MGGVPLYCLRRFLNHFLDASGDTVAHRKPRRPSVIVPKVGVISSPRTGDILRHGVGSRVHGSLAGEFTSDLVNIEAANCPCVSLVGGSKLVE